MVQRVDEDEKHEFEHKTGGRDGVKLLGKTGRELTETSFDGLAKVLQQKGFVRLMGTGTILFAGRLLAVAGRFFEQVFPGVVRVAGVGVQDAAFGQVRAQAPQASLVGFAAGVDVIVHGNAVSGGHDLDLKAVKLAALADTPPVIGLVFQQLAAGDAGPKCLIRILWHTATGKESIM